MTSHSLTRRLVTGVLLAELTCAAGLSWLAVWHEEQGMRSAFDIMLRGRADSVLGAIRDAEDIEDSVAVDPAELSVPAQDAYAVLTPQGQELSRSPGTPDDVIRALERPHQEGYYQIRAGHERLRAVRFIGARIIDREQGQPGVRRAVVVLYASPSRQLWVSAVAAARYSVVASALTLALTAVVLAWFLRRSLDPLHFLADAAARVTVHHWEFQPPEAVLQARELQPIAASIRDLLAGLQFAFERQRRFTGDAAHELKTSIAVLKSSLQLLTMRPRAADQYQRGLSGLSVDLRRMEELVEQMLALARLEEADSMGEPQPLDLRQVVTNVAQRLEPLARAKQVKITVEAESYPASVAVLGDDAHVLSSNLILNAIQHSPAGGEVSVSVTTRGGVAELHVQDAGPGISSEALPRVFERFYRADASRSRHSGGAGLGLAICKAIVDRSNGTITIRSAAGAGTRVQVTLPLHRDCPPPDSRSR
ncbi:MAG: HAMP domain-containing histidine kinase [Acidobacteriota bacterium]|nr:HAMP domain-containing histidine kinase [Acidobacteriota bacterium]